MVSPIFIVSCVSELVGLAILTCGIPDALFHPFRRDYARLGSVSRFVSRVLQRSLHKPFENVHTRQMH
jgi:hypothetical protein